MIIFCGFERRPHTSMATLQRPYHVHSTTTASLLGRRKDAVRTPVRCDGGIIHVWLEIGRNDCRVNNKGGDYVCAKQL
ncbi:hypothetical protein DPMN_168135 [Dreissena polymorpha]|uniref:Uncharacterized protein n=1 Tax=Dreissena polymorpha TaxID=45954 RepID=A0A9D4F2Q8_DREPO|nr:hypothetical protein DPMN_168135 [Dreissena polymorpha]